MVNEGPLTAQFLKGLGDGRNKFHLHPPLLDVDLEDGLLDGLPLPVRRAEAAMAVSRCENGIRSGVMAMTVSSATSGL